MGDSPKIIIPNVSDLFPPRHCETLMKLSWDMGLISLANLGKRFPTKPSLPSFGYTPSLGKLSTIIANVMGENLPARVKLSSARVAIHSITSSLEYPSNPANSEPSVEPTDEVAELDARLGSVLGSALGSLKSEINSGVILSWSFLQRKTLKPNQRLGI